MIFGLILNINMTRIWFYSIGQSDALATAMNTVATTGTLVVGPGHHEKDSLAALAAAAEMDQVRADVVVSNDADIFFFPHFNMT